ncbi:MAG: hypothetical protein Salg2KO_01880 [Salibacteraceae bacterium]
MGKLSINSDIDLTVAQMQELVPIAARQLNKDAQLAGIRAVIKTPPVNEKELLNSVVSFIKMAKSNNPNWENLNYCLDLPKEITSRLTDDHQYAEVIVRRLLLKAYTRMKFKTA